MRNYSTRHTHKQNVKTSRRNQERTDNMHKPPSLQVEKFRANIVAEIIAPRRDARKLTPICPGRSTERDPWGLLFASRLVPAGVKQGLLANKVDSVIAHPHVDADEVGPFKGQGPHRLGRGEADPGVASGNPLSHRLGRGEADPGVASGNPLVGRSLRGKHTCETTQMGFCRGSGAPQQIDKLDNKTSLRRRRCDPRPPRPPPRHPNKANAPTRPRGPSRTPRCPSRSTPYALTRSREASRSSHHLRHV